MKTNFKPNSFWLIAIFCSVHFSLHSQNIDHCASDDVHDRLIEEDPDYAAYYEFNRKTYREKLRRQRQGQRARASNVDTVPVVVHIIHSGESLGTTANPSDSDINTIIGASSERFRHMQPNAPNYSNPNYGIDTEIEFCLASKDPNGNFTSGIMRYYDPANAVGTYNETALDLLDLAWDRDNYCNLYIMTNLTNASGVYLGGYDFTVYNSPSFWSGLIAHEIGHYFTLRHTFYNLSCVNDSCDIRGDEICDTPPINNSGFKGGSCTNQPNTCDTDTVDTRIINPYRPISQGGMGDQDDMLDNYMDYTGSCWDSFTEGQKTRMKNNISTSRTDLVTTNDLCSYTATNADDVGVFHIYSDYETLCDDSLDAAVTIVNYGTNTLTSVDIDLTLNGTTTTESWSGSLDSGSSMVYNISNVVVLTSGVNTIDISTSNPNGVNDTDTSNDQKSINLEFFGGDPCSFINACSDFAANTASGPGNTTVVDVSGTFPTSNVIDVEICVTTNGDVSSNQETFDVTDEFGSSVGTTNSGGDCSGPTTQICFSPVLSDYYTWATDGVITVTFDPTTTAINPNLCFTNQACVEILIAESSCVAVLDVVTNPVPSGTYQATDTVKCAVDVDVSTDVMFKAGTEIYLKNGFFVPSNADFEAKIDSCN